MNLPRVALPDARYRWWALGVTIIGCFMSMLDTSIVNIAIPKMMAVFAVDTDAAQWILTAYMLTMGVVQPLTGYSCDVFGTRRMYLASLAVFTLGSALCGTAWSNDSMILFRVVQAVGGGLIVPVTMTIVYNNFSRDERYMAMGIWGIAAMVAPAVGPTLSGYLTQYWDWRLIFTLNIPLGIIGYILAFTMLKETGVRPGAPFDAGGFVTSATGLCCLLLALSKGAVEGWTSAYIVTLFYVAFVSLAFFVAIELYHENPLLDLTIFRNWNFSCCSILVFIGTTGLYGGLFLVPLFMQNMRNYTAMKTGMLIFPSALTSGLMMPVAARLAKRFGPKAVVIAGLTILGISSLPFINLDMDTDYYAVMLGMIARGVGLGLFVMTATALGMNTIPLAKVSRATSINSSIRQISGSFGIALLMTVLQNRQTCHLAHNAEAINTASISALQVVTRFEGLLKTAGEPAGPAKQVLTYLDYIYAHTGFAAGAVQTKALAMISNIVRQQSYIFAFDDAFVVLALICFGGLLPALFLKAAKNKNAGT